MYSRPKCVCGDRKRNLEPRRLISYSVGKLDATCTDRWARPNPFPCRTYFETYRIRGINLDRFDSGSRFRERKPRPPTPPPKIIRSRNGLGRADELGLTPVKKTNDKNRVRKIVRVRWIFYPVGRTTKLRSRPPENL